MMKRTKRKESVFRGKVGKDVGIGIRKQNGVQQIYQTISLLEKFLTYQNYSDLVGLYMFYCKMGIQQGTNQVWATNPYCMKRMHIGLVRFYAAKKVLKKLKLIEQIPAIHKDGKFGKSYVKLTAWGKSTGNKAVTNLKPVVKEKPANPDCPNRFTKGKDFKGYKSFCEKCELRNECQPNY